MKPNIRTGVVIALVLCASVHGRSAPPGAMMDLMQSNPPAPVITLPADCGGVAGDLNTGLLRILGADGKSLAGAVVWSAKPAVRRKPDPAIPESLRVIPGVQAAGLVLGEKLDTRSLPSHLKLYAPMFLPYSGPNVYLWRDDGALVQVYHHKHIIQAVAVTGKVVIIDKKNATSQATERWPTWAQAAAYVPVAPPDDHGQEHTHPVSSVSAWMETRGAIGVLALAGLLAGWVFGRHSGRLRR